MSPRLQFGNLATDGSVGQGFNIFPLAPPQHVTKNCSKAMEDRCKNISNAPALRVDIAAETVSVPL